MQIEVRPAVPADIPDIFRLLAHYAAEERLLSRSEEELMEHVRDFFVAEADGVFSGCCALKIYDGRLAEIRSLAVQPDENRRGIGRALLAACEADAGRYGIARVFALTFVSGFFLKAGYSRVEKQSLPQKIWRDCFKCPMFPDCQEIAVVKDGV